MRSSSFLIMLAGLVMLSTGCSSLRPYHSGRAGLLDGGRGLSRSSVQAARAVGRRERVSVQEASVAVRDSKLGWPLKKVHFTSHYGERGSDFHEGVDLRAPSGTSVHAAGDGIVLYADKRISGYGRMVVLRHSNGLSTVYAHNSKLLVRRGQPVKRGQKIALSGNSGRSSGPHVHFEIRKGVAAVDPLRVLPKATGWALAEAPPARKGTPKRALASAKRPRAVKVR